jgi:hypothetical protein
VRNVEAGGEFDRLKVVHNSDEYFLLDPFKIFPVGGVVIRLGEPFKLQLIQKCPVCV